MSVNSVTQNADSVTIYRESFIEKVVKNHNLTLNDYKVLCLLLMHLDGFNRDRKSMKTLMNDFCGYTSIEPKAIAEELGISKKSVKESLYNLCNECILELGESPASGKGYRFDM